MLLLAVLLVTPAAQAETKRIFAVPPTNWDHTMSRDQPAQSLGPSDLANQTGGIVFGLSPGEVNAKLATPAAGIEWSNLPFAAEYPDEVRYFWVRLDALPKPQRPASCTGGNSYAVFLFRDRGLFRISWRLLPDAACPAIRAAAEELYARYLAIDGATSLASHYQAGTAEVIEVTDPSADYLMPYRWANRQLQ